MTPDKESCPFCSPPVDRVFYRDDSYIGLWDAFPVSPGHALLIPKRHIQGVSELDQAERLAFFDALDACREQVGKEYEPAGFNIGINDGRAAGQTVMHLHVHLIPRFAGDQPDPRGGVRWIIPEKAAYWDGD